MMNNDLSRAERIRRYVAIGLAMGDEDEEGLTSFARGMDDEWLDYQIAAGLEQLGRSDPLAREIRAVDRASATRRRARSNVIALGNAERRGA